MADRVRTMSETERAESERLTRELDQEIDHALATIPEGRIALIREAFQQYEADTFANWNGTDSFPDRLAIFSAGWIAAWKHLRG